MPPAEPYGTSSGTSSGTPPGTSSGTTPPGDRKSAELAGEKLSTSEVTDVFRTLAAHGGAAASIDLALDLVLNEVVEQARLATGATGAAIGLIRDGEMVCRATTGGDAPDLGVRFEMVTGLSGECLQTGKIQQCDDTDTDPRVNAEACRSLGVRSILVLPLSEGNEPFGILEVFSSRPNSFRARDLSILQVVAHRVVETKRGAEAAATGTVAQGEPYARSNDIPLTPFDEELLKYDSVGLEEAKAARRSQLWTYVLGVLVIFVSVLLGLALGWRNGAGRRASPTTNAARGAASASEVPSAMPSAGSLPVSSPVRSRVASPVQSNEPQTGGLLVTQDGKVIYRLPPAEQSSTQKSSAAQEKSKYSSASGPNDARLNDTRPSDTRLIRRVEPRYPADARAQHIEGAVVLDLQIGKDGVVHDIAIVSGNSELAEAAVEAVRQWRYRPYSVDGHAVEMQTRITVRFKLPPT
jgi:TonB family protein